jgi:hypothetical protein
LKCKCPFCNRKFVRDPRSILTNKFCSKCIEQRVIKSGGFKITEMDKLVFTEGDYAFFEITPSKA